MQVAFAYGTMNQISHVMKESASDLRKINDMGEAAVIVLASISGAVQCLKDCRSAFLEKVVVLCHDEKITLSNLANLKDVLTRDKITFHSLNNVFRPIDLEAAFKAIRDCEYRNLHLKWPEE